MEAVRAFNNELSSLYESKPPVSRAKMAQVTKFAIKAIKFYKHVVQSVEKFIQKCKPEYKVPGLYVIDSIVRQSRHQFGPEKDVFSPRFTKNIVTTFTHLFKCAVEERSRVVRVLNLWQKNAVFSMDIIQPLLDLAADPDNPQLVSAAQSAVDSVVSSSHKIPLPGLPETQPSSNGKEANSSTQILQQSEMLSTITKLLKQAQEGTITNRAPETQLQQLQHLQQQLVMQTERITQPQQQQQQPAPPIDSNLLAQIQMLTSQLLSKPSAGGAKPIENTNNQISAEPLFNKKLLDFDYGDSDEDEDREEQQHFHQHHNQQQQRQPIEVPQQGLPKVMPEPNIFSKVASEPNTFPKVVPDQNILPKVVPDQNFFPNVVPDRNILSNVVTDRNSLPKGISDQNFFSNAVTDRNVLPNAVLDQKFFSSVAPDRNVLPKTMPDQNFFSSTMPDNNFFSNAVPDRNILSKAAPDQNFFPSVVPDQNFFPSGVPERNILPKAVPDQNFFPNVVPDRNILPKAAPDQNFFPSGVPDRNILPKTVPDQNFFPNVVPDRNILPKTVPDQNFFTSGVPDRNILPKVMPDQNILPQAMPDQNILPKAMPNQNILQKIQQMSQQQEQLQSEIGAQDQLRRRLLEQQQQQFDREIEQESLSGPGPTQGFGQDQDRRQDIDQDDRENHDRSSHRRQRDSRDRSPRRRSRRSRSRDRDRDRRRRSRSRDRHRRSRSRERERREKERERRKMGLPPLKSNNIAICSTTIWFGRLTKHTTEEELREHIEKYGIIRTINMIPPRGCAFVCVTKRKDASKVMDRLKGIKINGNTIKVAWAPGIGVKESVFKDSWDVDQGVTYIPWDQLPKDVVPLLAGGMVDEESLPDRLKGMKTGEEDEVQVQPSTDKESDVPHEDSLQSQQQPPQQPPQPPMGMPGLPSFPLPGQNPMPMMGPGGPLSLLSGPPPPIGIRPGMGLPNNMNALNSMGNLNINAMMGPPPNMPGIRPNLPGAGPNMPGMGPNMQGMGPNMHGMGPNMQGMGPNMQGMGPNMPGTGPNMQGMGPNMPGMGPRAMNIGPPQGSMMGGQANNMGGLGGPNMNTHTSPAGVNSPGPRGPFGQFGNVPRFPHMQNPGGMHPFVNNNIRGGGPSGMEDSDMRTMAETKEWPPDDEVNAEDESDEDHPMDSDERMLPMSRQQRMPGPGIPNLQALGNPFGLHRPILPSQGQQNSMLGIPRAPSPNTGMPSLISLRMMPPRQQPPVIAISSGPAPGFTLAPGSVRLSMPTVAVGQALLPAATSPHLIPTPPGAPLTVAVSVNGTVVVTGPGIPTSNTSVSSRVGDNPETNSEENSSSEDKLGAHPTGLVSLMQIHGGNRAPIGPILGRGFAPMTIRPRVGPGLLGIRPGAHGGSGVSRFGGSRPLMGPVFREMDRPPFGNRFGVPLRPPVGFLDQDEREDRDERRPLPRIDDDQPEVESGNDQSVPKDIDERRDSGEGKVRGQDIDMRQDIDERHKSGRSSGRPSRWGGGGASDETSKSTATENADGKTSDNPSGSNSTDSSISTPSDVERLPAATVAQPTVGANSVPTKIDSVPLAADGSVTTNDMEGEGKAVQPS